MKDDPIAANPDKEAWFGNFHVHTGYSFDGFTNGSIATPDDADRWAKGEEIPADKSGRTARILRPLDWYVVSDHAEMMGVFPRMADPERPFSRLPIAKRVTSEDSAEAFAAFAEILNDFSSGNIGPALTDKDEARPIWQEVLQTTDSHNEPGKFTTFAGYEWTSNPNQENLHRVVVFHDIDSVPELPFSALDSDRPEDLWAWMDQQRAAGTALLAIPHNGKFALEADPKHRLEGPQLYGSQYDAAAEIQFGCAGCRTAKRRRRFLMWHWLMIAASLPMAPLHRWATR